MDDVSILSHASAASSSSVHNDGRLPQLPMWRTNRTVKSNRKETMCFLEGKAHVGPSSLAEKTEEEDGAMSCSGSVGSLSLSTAGRRSKGFLGLLGNNKGAEVLCFHAYFEETIAESNVETRRVRECAISYYRVDDTVSVFEPRKKNAALAQGIFLKRHRVPKTAFSYYGLEDLDVGRSLELYGRVFHVVGCSEATRAALTQLRGAPPAPNGAAPVDRYAAEREAFMSRETGVDPTVKHNIRKTPMKDYAEAALGRPIVDQETRGAFVKYGTKVLRFYCTWDDSATLYGDVHDLKLHYFMVDGTVEVLNNVVNDNSGCPAGPKLIKRTKIPFTIKQSSSLSSSPPRSSMFYHWTDLSVGGVVDAYSRRLVLTGADAATREFYANQRRPLSMEVEEPDVAVVAPPVPARDDGAWPSKETQEARPPPSTGFGSEEDSLTSCTSVLVPRAPVKKFGEPGMLNFRARFEDPAPEDADRLFIVSFDMADSTVQVREPPRRNSGVLSGQFIQKQKLRKKDTDSSYLGPADLYVGARLDLAAHTFLLFETDVATLKYMDHRPAVFPHADLAKVTALLAAQARAAFPDKPLDSLHARVLRGRNHLAFADALIAIRAFAPEAAAPDHAILTFFRAHKIIPPSPASSTSQLANTGAYVGLLPATALTNLLAF